MLHSQLKIKFPDCPYVWDQYDLRQTYDVKQESLTRDEILDDVQNIFMNSVNNQVTDNTMINESMNFLETLAQDSSNLFTSKHYSRVAQTIPLHKKDVLVNFHTAAYNDDNGGLIDKEFSSIVSWLVIPIIGDVRTHSVSYTINKNNIKQTTNSRDVVMSSEMARALDPKTYRGYTDNGCEKIEADVRAQRTGMRNFIVRDPEPIKIQKRDIMVDTNITTDQTQNIVEPRKQQIEMNNNTRASAHLIRDRLMSSYKAHRIRNNPDAIKLQSRVDLSLKYTSNRVADTLNKNYRVLERDIDTEPFDYTYDQVGTKTFSAIYKFNPILSGRIGINIENTDKTTYFVTVMRHKSNLHITLHEIIFK